MKPEDREALIQRYYDGETVGAEAEQAERLLAEDPDAQAFLDGLRQISGFVRVGMQEAVEEEDFSTYWQEISSRLPEGPLTLENEVVNEPIVARSPEEVLEVRPSFLAGFFGMPWLRPALAGAVVALALFLVFRPGGQQGYPLTSVASNVIEIEEIDSPGPLVLVQQEKPELPAIIWIVESGGTEG